MITRVKNGVKTIVADVSPVRSVNTLAGEVVLNSTNINHDNIAISEIIEDLKNANDVLRNGIELCPQSGKFGRRYSLKGVIGGSTLTEDWNNYIPGVFLDPKNDEIIDGINIGPLGALTNTAFWNAQITQAGIAASSVAVRRADGGGTSNFNENGSALQIYPRYTGGAVGIVRDSAIVSFFMTSDEIHNEIKTLFINLNAIAETSHGHTYAELLEKDPGRNEAHLGFAKYTHNHDNYHANLIDGKVPDEQLPDILFGQLIHAGSFDPNGNTATATLTNNGKTKLGVHSNETTLHHNNIPVGAQECYFLAAIDGIFSGLDFRTGDWLVAHANGWGKIGNTDAVTGVKGNAETEYRLGNINLTAANIGAAEMNHKHTIGAGDNQVAPPSWIEVTNKPTTFAPETHNHNISQINAGVTSARILGRTSTGTGAVEQREIGAGLTFDATSLRPNFTTSGGNNGTATTVARGDHDHTGRTLFPGACTTPAATRIKSIPLALPSAGYLVQIAFNNGNSSPNLQLQFTGATARDVWWNGAIFGTEIIENPHIFDAGTRALFYFNGTQFEQIAVYNNKAPVHTHFEEPVPRPGDPTVIDMNNLHNIVRGGGVFFMQPPDFHIGTTPVGPPATSLGQPEGGRYASLFSNNPNNPLTPMRRNWSWCKMDVSWLPQTPTRNPGVRILQQMWPDMDATKGFIRMGNSYQPGSNSEDINNINWTDFEFCQNPTMFRVRGPGVNNCIQNYQELIYEVTLTEQSVGAAAAYSSPTSPTTAEGGAAASQASFIQFLLDEHILLSIGRNSGNAYDIIVNNYRNISATATTMGHLYRSGAIATTSTSGGAPGTVSLTATGAVASGAASTGTAHNHNINHAHVAPAAHTHNETQTYWYDHRTLAALGGAPDITDTTFAGVNPTNSNRVFQIPLGTSVGTKLELEIHKNLRTAMQTSIPTIKQKRGYKVSIILVATGVLNIRAEKLY